jgi:hypothetical protein
MAKRKTFLVEALKRKVNHRNRTSTCTAAARDGWNSVLSDVLMETGNYKGFRYLTQEEVPPGYEPGGIWHEDPTKRLFPDESRREYF